MEFASTPIKLPDGQNTVPAFPEEVALRGFYPPVRMPDSSIEKGDVLPAGWLNRLMHEAFAIPPAFYFDHRVNDQTFGSSAGSQNISYFRSDRMLVQFGGWRVTNDANSYRIDFPIQFSPGTYPLIVAWDPSGNLPGYFWVDSSSVSNTGATLWWKAPNGITNPGSFFFIAMGQWSYGSGTAAPTSSIMDFCPEPTTFIDGQTSFSQPSADQISFGFVPSRQLSDGTIIPGDTLPANVLNYLLHDIFANRSNKIQATARFKNQNTAYPSYTLNIGALKLTMWRATVPAGGALMPYPESFFAGNAVTVLGNAAFPNPAGMSAGDYRFVGVNPALNGVNANVWGGSNLGTSIITDTTFLAIGLSGAPDLVPPVQHYNSAVSHLPGFAMNARTYEDGQANKVAPSAAQLANGFLPTHRLESGIIQQGDLITANKLNYLFDQLYKQDFSHGEKRVIDEAFPATPVTTVQPGTQNGWACIEGDTWIAYTGKAMINGTNFAQDATTKFFTFPYLKPFKSGTKPMMFAVDDNTNNNMLLWCDTTLGDNTAAKMSVVSANNPSVLRDLPVGGGSGWAMRFFIIGLKA